jgi:hypothetical protein
MAKFPTVSDALTAQLAAIDAKLTNIEIGTDPELYFELSYKRAVFQQAIGVALSGDIVINNVGITSLPTTVRDANVTVESSSGTVAAGARSLSIANSGIAAGTVQGELIAAGMTYSWQAPNNDTLNSVSYDATGTTLVIIEVR